MTTENFIQHPKPWCLYHFTDLENLPLIREHGLLSTQELQRRGITPPKPGGDTGSQISDARYGADRFVHLCLTNDNDMAYRKEEAGHIGPICYLEIHTNILREEGVSACETFTNTGTPILPLAEALASGLPDMEIIIEARESLLKVLSSEDSKTAYLKAKKAEILVPDCIPKSFILNLEWQSAQFSSPSQREIG